MNNKTASILIIGNEILSGKVLDINTKFLAVELEQIGIKLCEVRIIPDLEQEIIDSVNSLRKRYNYVFTTGGIGPTHDDITSLSIAKAFSVNYVLNEEILAIIKNVYSDEKNINLRIKMAYIPEGATLIGCEPVAKIPSFKIENVFVFAGVPKIMQAMFLSIRDEIDTGLTIFTKSINVYVSECVIANDLTLLQNEYPNIEIGSYPFSDKIGTTLSLKSYNEKEIDEAMPKLMQKLNLLQVEYSPV